MRQAPGLSAPLAAFGLFTYGVAGGAAAHVAAMAWGTTTGLFVAAPWAVMGLLLIASGTKGIH